MLESDPLQILLAHDRWAMNQLLDVCQKLPAEDFLRRFDIGVGSLHDTITHMIAVIQTWTDTLIDQPLRPRLDTDGQQRTPEQLHALLDEAYPAFVSQAQRLPLDQFMSRRMRNGSQIKITRGAIFVQVATHGTHHRAQCLNMLKQVGVKPLPPSSVAEWTWSK